MGEDVRREAGGGEEERIRRGRERGWMGGEGGEMEEGGCKVETQGEKGSESS